MVPSLESDFDADSGFLASAFGCRSANRQSDIWILGWDLNIDVNSVLIAGNGDRPVIIKFINYKKVH